MSEAAGISVTLKGGKDFAEPWIVFKGTVQEVQQQIIQAFGYSADAALGLDLAGLTRNASNDFHNLGHTLQALPGSRVVPLDLVDDPPWDVPNKSWPPAAAVDALVELLNAISAAPNMQAIQGLYQLNRELFLSPQAEAAVKSRRTALGL